MCVYSSIWPGQSMISWGMRGESAPREGKVKDEGTHVVVLEIA